jgi:hypothetical protein
VFRHRDYGGVMRTIALTGTVEVPLQSPLGDRTVISRF